MTPIDLGSIDLQRTDLGTINLGTIDLGGGHSSWWDNKPDYNADFNQDFRAALPEE